MSNDPKKDPQDYETPQAPNSEDLAGRKLSPSDETATRPPDGEDAEVTGDAMSNEQADTAPQIISTEHPQTEQSPLDEETVDEIKKAILFGTNVGYKRPPKQSRFKKGQSGNPKGRPKSVNPSVGNGSVNALTLEESQRLVTIREGDETRKITTLEAIIRSQVKSATGGGQYAQKHFIERQYRAEAAQRFQLERDIEVWEWYVATQREKIAEAERNGEAPPSELPHPDDVVIDYEKGVSFIGPTDENGAMKVLKTCKLRDVLLMQYGLDLRSGDETADGDPLERPTAALLFATMLNDSLPVRFKLSDIEIKLKMLRFAGTPKRELLKMVYRDWREIGLRPPRGWVFPSLVVAELSIDMLWDALQEIRHGAK